MTKEEWDDFCLKLRANKGDAYLDLICANCNHRLGYHGSRDKWLNHCLLHCEDIKDADDLPCKCNGFELDTFERLVRNIRND
jgi:hypothetical protein